MASAAESSESFWKGQADMCGIVAMFSRGGPVSVEALKRAMQTLHHRGPDGERHWVAPHGRVALGHARLSIIDLVTGDQPIANEDERLHIIVNGEFYDYERIQRELTSRGHKLRTHSDSEIALHLYEDYGASALQELRGEFAIILWDEANGTLMAVRDRFGVKPLCYSRNSATRSILPRKRKRVFAAGVPARWDHESFFQLSHVYFDQDRSLFDGVRQVPPGCYLLATQQHTQIVRYWDFDYPRIEQPRPALSDDEHIERMRSTLDEAVRIRLRADVPVGCYLSGGLDTALLGIASKHHNDPIEAFTLCFDVDSYNEEFVAKEMAEHAHANFHPLPIKQTQLADNFSDAIWHSETLTANPHGVAKFLLSQMVRDHGFKVVLTGEGSDEILGGYAHFRRDMLLYNSAGQDPQEVDRLLKELADNNEVSRGVYCPAANRSPWRRAHAGLRAILARGCARRMRCAIAGCCGRTFWPSSPIATRSACF